MYTQTDNTSSNILIWQLSSNDFLGKKKRFFFGRGVDWGANSPVDGFAGLDGVAGAAAATMRMYRLMKR